VRRALRGPGPHDQAPTRIACLRRAAVTALVLALLAGTAAAFVVTEELKLERSPIARPQFDRIFSPVCDCVKETARLVFGLRSADTIDAVIVDADGDPVRTLASGSRRGRGRVVFRWGGRDDAGALVPEGVYRLQVRLADQRRTIVIPNRIRVDTTPPIVVLEGVAPRRLSPDGDGRNDTARVTFSSSERARPLVLVDGAVAARGRIRAAGTKALAWRGTKAGKPLPAGLYALSLEARDRAGNLSDPTAATAVTIRYIEVAGDTLTARRGGLLRFHVLTDAMRFRWALVAANARRPLLRRSAKTTAVAVRLPARVRPGRYVLRVAANGHSDEAPVVVRARR
jgi:hypothetical protein